MFKKLYILLLVLSISSVIELKASSLKLIRTDVDSARSGFVTATYIFGFDIVADSLDHASNIAFELLYTNVKSIKFSEWKIGNYGPGGDMFILELPSTDPSEGRLAISAGTGNPPDLTSPNNPKVVHLEFAVIPAALHSETVTFSIVNPKATVYNDTATQIITLDSDPTTYKIHSYINVWPGDADNNGIVDHLDFASVSYFLGMGPNAKSLRSFRRVPANTLWYAQPVIAWDSATATYADCDGNGEVNMSDNLVVTYNYDKKRPGSGIIKSVLNVLPNRTIIKSDNAVLAPVYAESDRQYLAASGKICAPDGFKIIGFEKGDIFKDDYSFAEFVVNESASCLEFITGNVLRTELGGNEHRCIGMAVLEPIDMVSGLPEIQTEDMKAIDLSGSIFELSKYSDVKATHKNSEIKAVYNSGILRLNLPENAANSSVTVKIFDSRGTEIFSEKTENSLNNSEMILKLGRMSQGAYYTVVSFDTQDIVTVPFIVVN